MRSGELLDATSLRYRTSLREKATTRSCRQAALGHLCKAGATSDRATGGRLDGITTDAAISRFGDSQPKCRLVRSFTRDRGGFRPICRLVYGRFQCGKLGVGSISRNDRAADLDTSNLATRWRPWGRPQPKIEVDRER